MFVINGSFGIVITSIVDMTGILLKSMVCDIIARSSFGAKFIGSEKSGAATIKKLICHL